MTALASIPTCEYHRNRGFDIAAPYRVLEHRTPQSGIGPDWDAHVPACTTCAVQHKAKGATVTVHPAAASFRTMKDLPSCS